MPPSGSQAPASNNEQIVSNDPEQVEGEENGELYQNPTVEEIAAQLGDFEYGAPNNEDGDNRNAGAL